MRALLDLMRDNEAEVQNMPEPCRFLLRTASAHLKIIHPERGQKELINLVAAALAKLSLPLREPGALVLCITPTSPLTPTSSLKRICALARIGASSPLLNPPLSICLSLALARSLSLFLFLSISHSLSLNLSIHLPLSLTFFFSTPPPFPLSFSRRAAGLT